MDKSTAVKYGLVAATAGAVAMNYLLGAHIGSLDTSPNGPHVGMIRLLCACGHYGD